MFSSRFIPWILLAVGLLGTVIQFIVYGPQLPANVGSHFNEQGVRDGSMSRTLLLLLFGGLQFGLAGMMLGLGKLMRVMPISMINIPHREYWLHEDRRDETLAYMQQVMVWIAACTAIFMVFTLQLTIDANLAGPEPQLNMPVFWTVLVVYMVAIGAICVVLFRRFRRTPKEG
ncbi:MAG: hypothetical protein ACR2NP_21495 [Pirellulaceae bacterium]